MKKNTILMLTAVFVVILAAACSAPAAPATQAAAPAVEQPVQQPAVVQPTQEQPAAAPVATDAPTQAPTTLVFPDTVAAETYCANKIPYQNIFLEDGATFEPVDANSELKCNDSGTDVDGKNVITCTGKELWTYDLKITTAEGSGIMKINIGACPLPQ